MPEVFSVPGAIGSRMRTRMRSSHRDPAPGASRSRPGAPGLSVATAASYDGSVPQPPRPGELLVARAGELDGYFARSVVLLLDHDAGGTLGVCLDRLSGYALAEVLPGWEELVSPPGRLFEGGPVSREGAICVARLANPREDPPGFRRVFDDIGLLHLDTPTELVRGGYTDLRIFAGYAGWSPGQLEHELVAGAWHRVSSHEEDIFGVRPDGLWRRVLRRQGGDLALYSSWSRNPELN